MKSKTLGIIGAGRLAKSLLMNCPPGYEISWALARSEEGRAALRDEAAALGYSLQAAASFGDTNTLPDAILLAVSDNAIEELSSCIASHYGDGLKGRQVIHFSGINRRDILSSCSRAGAAIHKAHPYQTFYYPDKGVFKGIYWGVEYGSEPDFIDGFIAALEGNIVDLSGKDTTDHVKYHASAVAASNFLNTLLAFSRELLGGIGVDDRIVQPIIQQTIANAFRGGDFPLTGPIARGDTETVVKHLEALGDNRNETSFYAQMSLITAGMCLERGMITREQYQRFEEVLKQFI